MNHLQRFLMLLVCTGLVSGCMRTPPPRIEGDPTVLVPSVTATLTPGPTGTFTAALPTLTPAYTATPLPPQLPTLRSSESSSYDQLAAPSEEDILRLIDINSLQHIYYNYHYNESNREEYDFILEELYNIRDILDDEIGYYYPDGFSDPELAWDFYPPPEERWQPFYSSVYLDLLADAVLVNLQKDHPNISDGETIQGRGYEAKVHQIELDRDSSPEWLVRIDWTDISSLSWLTLDQAPDLTFTKLDPSLPSMYSWEPSEDQIQALKDFTGDGLTDIIFLDYGYVWGTDFGTFYISQGTKNGFKQLDEIGVSIPGYLSEGLPFTVDTPTGSRWLSLSISDPHDLNWGCKWDTVTTYRWPSGTKQESIKDKVAPDTPDCNLARAVHLYEAPDDRTSAQLLEKAIKGFDTSDADFKAKQLFTHYRLAILYAALGKDSQSRQQIDWLIQNLDASNRYFRSSLQALLDDPQMDPLRLCDAMYSAADADIPEEWKKFVNATAALNAYPYSPEIYPPVICPLQKILSDKLEKVNWKAQPLTEKALADQGIPVHLMRTYPVPDQKVPASFMLVGDRSLYVLAYVPAMTGWEWRLLDNFSSVNGLPKVFNQDITGDGYTELAYYQPRKDMWWCPENEQGHEIFLTTYSGFGLVSLSQSICLPKDQPFDINSQLADENADGIVDWVADQIRESAGDSFLTAERMAPVTWFTPDEIYAMLPDPNNSKDSEVDLAAELYTGNHPAATRQKLMAELDGLSPADPFVERRWQRLTYLIAISYELEGQSDKAVETFKSVLESDPQTLWANLAELHLAAE